MRGSMIRILEPISRLGLLDKLGEKLQHVVTRGLESLGPNQRAVRNLLHGTWMGHPLHPVLTDVAIGGFTATVTLDLLDQFGPEDAFARGADAALGLGLLGGLASAVTGANDWQHTDGKPRRLGVLHALLNSTATLLFTASMIARLAGARGAGRGLASLGFGISMTAAYIGGDLVYGHQIGVNHAAGTSGPEEFTPVSPDSELREDEPRRAEVEGAALVLVRHAGRVHALAATCSHLGGPLPEGKIEDGGIMCPWHGSRFSVEDGSVLDGPATFPQPCYETRVQGGQIEVRAQRA